MRFKLRRWRVSLAHREGVKELVEQQGGRGLVVRGRRNDGVSSSGKKVNVITMVDG